MSRSRPLAKGAAALILLSSLAAVIPWALTRFVGWPLPHRLPTWQQLTTALTQHGIPDDTLIKALACVVWLAWAILILSLAVELHAVARGGTARRVAIAGPLQPAISHLLAAVAIAALSISPRGNPAPQRSLAASIPTLRPPAPTVALAAADSSSITSAGPASSAVTSAADPAGRTYVVRRNDTLWAIAERQLGDPLRWRDIYDLNHGRPQPGGETLTDPHWIYQGWTLLLPATTTETASPASPALTHAPAPSRPFPTDAPPPAVATPLATPAEPSTDPSTPTTNGNLPATPDREHASAATPEPPGGTVTLPSGSVVAASFAAGVLATITVGRLRRRHGYHPASPEPGRSLAAPPLGPTLRRLSAALAGPDGEPATPPPQAAAGGDDERRVIPDLIEIGEHDGTAITAKLTDLSGTALIGAAADQVARAWITALLTRAGPLAAEVIATSETVGRLFGAGSPASGFRATADTPQLIRILEAEIVARTRLLESADLPDAIAYRQANPAEPLPGLAFVFDPLAADNSLRLKPTMRMSSRLGITVLFLGETIAAVARLRLDQRTVAADDGNQSLSWIQGARLFGLSVAEAADILAALTHAEFRPTSEENPEWTETVERMEHPPPPSEPWPAQPSHPQIQQVDRPVQIEALGPLTITVAGNTINRGFRSVAKELLVYYLLRPEGATVEEAVDHLWPDTDPKLVHRQFWTAASNLRSRLREWGDLESKILHQTGEVYRLDPEIVCADIWNFQGALNDAAQAADATDNAEALRRAVDAYRGDIAETSGWLWLEPAREDLHRRAVDAHLRLAELEDAAGNTAGAAAVLEKVIDLDRFAEEPYRRLMTLHAGQGRIDSVKATWRKMQRCLVEIDLDPDPATARLYRTLVSEDHAA